MIDYNLSVVSIQEHRYMHNDGDPGIVAHNLGDTTLFTALATKNSDSSSRHKNSTTTCFHRKIQ